MWGALVVGLADWSKSLRLPEGSHTRWLVAVKPSVPVKTGFSFVSYVDGQILRLCLFLSIYIYVYTCLSICLSIYLSTHLSISFSLSLSLFDAVAVARTSRKAPEAATIYCPISKEIPICLVPSLRPTRVDLSGSREF